MSLVFRTIATNICSSFSAGIRHVSCTPIACGGAGFLNNALRDEYLREGRDPNGPNQPFVLNVDETLSTAAQEQLPNSDKDKIQALLDKPQAVPKPSDPPVVHDAFVELQGLRAAKRN